jgi:predicted ATPase/class 3 adenylate cyclase
MPDAPSGTVTFLFTDIEGSTKRWEQQREVMSRVLACHDNILRQVIEGHGGYVFKTVGDAFCAAFPTPRSALEAAQAAQRRLHEEHEELSDLKVRMALHTGMTEERDGDYFGPTLNRVARLMSAGHGGQVLLSQAVCDLVRDDLPSSMELRDLGEHGLKDLTRREHIFQVVAPGLASEFPPLHTPDNRPNNLPRQATALVGREQETGKVLALLRRLDVALVTLTGAGGTGKTRLSLQVGAEALDDFPDGVWFVELASLTDHNFVVSTIAKALGVSEAAGKPLVDTLIEYLRDKELLLVLDNFEHLLDASRLVALILKTAPRVKVLATSRVRLNIYGEHEYGVPPLSLPTEGVWRSTLLARPVSLETLTQYEAVRLFIERAQAARADFQMTIDNAPAVAEICVRLDGLPLAIELAAARVKVLPPQALLSRLEHRLKLLTGGTVDLPVRQQTLRDTLEWSYDLLNDEERKLFRRLAVFVGGRTLEAIEAVCNAEDDLGIDLLDGVQSLIDKSLLRQEEGVGGEPRFVMLETIHEYARDKLEESGEARVLAKEHAAYFLRLAEEAEPHLTSAKQQEWLLRLEEEHDNLRATLGWALARGEAETALRLGWSLSHFWQFLGYLSEGRKWLEGALQLPGAQQHALARALALVGAGYLAWRQHDFAAAIAYSRQSAAIWRQLQARGESGPEVVRGLAGARAIEGISSTFLGDEAGRARSEEALVLLRQADDKGGLAGALVVLGLGQVAIAQADYAAARAVLEEGVGLFRQWGDTWGLAQALNSLGDIARIEGNYARAEVLYEETLMLHRRLDSRADFPASLHNLGYATLGVGNARRAAAFFVEALKLYVDLKDQAGVVECLAGLAGVAGAEHQPERAARLFGAAEALREALNAPLWPAERADSERNKATARAQLSEEEFEKAWAEGQAMNMEQAIEYALEQTPEG